MTTKTLLTISLLALVPACKKSPPPPEESAGSAEAVKTRPTTAEPTAAEAPAADEYQAVDPIAGAGTISGSVTYDGSETDAKIMITKDDSTCCAACSAKQKQAGALVVNGGKLANVVVWLPEVKKGKKMEKMTPVVNNVGCLFEPHVSIGFKGGTLAAKNSDPVLHNTHLFLQTGNKDLVNIALPTQGQMVEKSLKKAGIVSVKCDAHEWMQAWVFVAANPYAVVSGADGAFKIEGVPPGEHNVKVWHERLGEKDAKVKVDAGGSATLAIAYH